MIAENIEKRPSGDEVLAFSENSFLEAEKLRQKQGFKHLRSFLDLRSQKVRDVFGIDDIAPDFSFETDWLESTGEYFIETEITTPKYLGISVVGVRYQNNVINREAVKSEILCPVGGGVRVSFVQGQPRVLEDGAVVDNAVDIANLDVQFSRLKKEGAALATTMVPKIMGLQFTEHLCDLLGRIDREDLIEKARKIILGGGAKADIFVARPDDLEKSEELELIFQVLKACGYEWAKMGAVGPEIDRMAGDRNSTGTLNGRPVIEGLLDGITEALQERSVIEEELGLVRAAVTGKRVGGLEARADATGLGCWESLKSYAEQKGVALEGKSVFFRGCGSAARRAIIEAHRAGMRVIGISDINAVLHCEEGFTEQDAHELFEVSVNQRGSIADWARGQIALGRNVEIHAEPVQEEFDARLQSLSESVVDYWEAHTPEVIFESAAQMTLNQKTAEHVPNGAIVVEGANGATTPIAAGILCKKDVARIPGINCNAGGVFVSWLEWAQDILGVKFTTEAVEQAVAKLMSNNMRATLKLIEFAEQHGVSLTQEEAFYSLAIARGLSARRQFAEKVNG